MSSLRIQSGKRNNGGNKDKRDIAEERYWSVDNRFTIKKNSINQKIPFDTALVARLILRCCVIIRIHVPFFDRQRTSLPKHYEALVADTTACDVFITLQKRLSPERKPCSGKKVFPRRKDLVA